MRFRRSALVLFLAAAVAAPVATASAGRGPSPASRNQVTQGRAASRRPAQRTRATPARRSTLPRPARTRQVQRQAQTMSARRPARAGRQGPGQRPADNRRGERRGMSTSSALLSIYALATAIPGGAALVHGITAGEPAATGIGGFFAAGGLSAAFLAYAHRNDRD
ncbi:MAG TPA: hypothetical protein VKZ63_02025 [Kofleriaceae bacterium]|nr:hypothetical protein [Kofleriaceae bacterium]